MTLARYNRPGLPLSRRQRDVMTLAAQGKQTKLIARALGLSTETVRVHLYAAFKRLGVNNRTEAAIRFLQEGA